MGPQKGFSQLEVLTLRWSFILFSVRGDALSRMVAVAAQSNLIGDFKTAMETHLDNHLQFAGNMPILYVADEQMKNIKAILLCLKAISSLMIIFFQSELIGFKTHTDYLLQLVDIMGVK